MSTTIYAPSSTLAAPRAPTRLAGTGTTEAGNATALPIGVKATLLVGAVSIRITWRRAVGGATQVAVTDIRLDAFTAVEWDVTDDDKAIYIEAADGASAYEAWFWASGVVGG